jgi:hypothetical protein
VTSWRRANKLRVVDGVCHICKGDADGRPLFQTRFCDLCLKRGMDLEYGVSSKYSLIATLYKIQTTYGDIISDVERFIGMRFPLVQKESAAGDKKFEEESWPSSSSSKYRSLGTPSEAGSYSVDSVPLPSTVGKTSDVKRVSG